MKYHKTDPKSFQLIPQSTPHVALLKGILMFCVWLNVRFQLSLFPCVMIVSKAIQPLKFLIRF